MLRDYLSEDRIQLHAHVADWQEAVETCGALLIKAGICETRYVEAMVKAVNTLGPYMVLAPGIALAHARPEDGVLKVGMAILTLAIPVDFGSPENDPVSLVIGFGGVDKHSHIGMLQELAMYLSEESNQRLLKTAEDVKAVMAALSS